MSEPDPAPDPGLDYSGHRARLRERLFADAETLHDHELIEYLLALAIPRRDTKPLARRLLAEFGDFGRLMAADPAAIARIGKLSENAVAAIKIVEAAALRLLKAKIVTRPVLANWQALLDYLRADMAHRDIERVRVLHLDSKNRLMRDDLVAEGTIDQAAVHVREILRRAIDVGSAALILVHNHPSGDPAPSRADIQLTRELIGAARPLGITLHDHIVVGANGHASMRSLGLI
jgi:DNA repair protein RadC